MYRANHLAHPIDIAPGHYTPRMRTFMRKGKKLIPEFSNTDLFTFYFRNGNIIRRKFQRLDTFSDLFPGVFFFQAILFQLVVKANRLVQYKNSVLYG